MKGLKLKQFQPKRPFFSESVLECLKAGLSYLPAAHALPKRMLATLIVSRAASGILTAREMIGRI